MAEYIEREALLIAFGEEPQIWIDEAAEVQANDDWHVYTGVVKALPAADVAPVVRCRDCQYWQDNNGGYPHNECRWGKEETPDPDDFCSYGERKEG